MEMNTEQLSEYLERDIGTENPQEFREKVINITNYCERRRENLLAHVHEGRYNDTWLYND